MSVREHLTPRNLLFGAITIIVVAVLIPWAWTRAMAEIHGHDYWFTYSSVDFVAADDDGLVFISEVDWVRSVDEVTFQDRLFCYDATDLRSVSHTSETVINPSFEPERRLRRWTYSGGHPKRGRCEIHSTIIATTRHVTTTQRIYSRPFHLGEKQ